MKRFKKIFALLIAMVMVFGMSTTAFAGTITIQRDESYDGSDGRTYKAYKVFDADTSLVGTNNQDDKQPTYDPNGPIAYSMATDSPWATVMQNVNQTWFDVNLAADESKYIITPKAGVNDSNAADIAAYLKENVPAGLTGTSIVPGTPTTVDNGYYLIVASDGATNVTLVTTNVTIVEKNTYIVTTKTTAETSYSVGDIIEYTATVFVPLDASLDGPIILHDKMDAVLAFNKDSVGAKIGVDTFTGFSVIDNCNDGCTFELSIPVTQDLRGKTITFTYSAELTSAAVDPDTGFINSLYGEKNDYTTTPDEVKVYTFDFDLIKVFQGTTINDSQFTATFELRTNANDANSAIAFIATGEKYVKADSDDTGTITEITVNNGTPVNFQGLEAGTYYLVETGTSTGYNLLKAPVAVTISDSSVGDSISHTVSPVDDDDRVVVINNKGTVLPSTGGIGTTMFYVAGGALVLAAVVLLVTRKRMSVEK